MCCFFPSHFRSNYALDVHSCELTKIEVVMGGKQLNDCLECFRINRLLIGCPACELITSVILLQENVPVPKSIIESSINGLSANCRSDEDRDDLLLPEFNELVKDFGSSPKASFSPCKDVETPLQDADSSKENKIVGRDVREQEIENLNNIVKTLKERERTREIQLLEYYGHKEQVKAIAELQNRLRINNVEAKHLGLKIESLKAEKMRLEAQVAESARVVSELEAAKLKIKQLKEKRRLGADRNKEQLLSLKERVLKLEDKEKNPVETESDVQLKLQKLNDLSIEANELRKSNQRLKEENSTLAGRLESVQMIAITALGNDEVSLLFVNFCFQLCFVSRVCVDLFSHTDRSTERTEKAK